jgi:hypothetical protein
VARELEAARAAVGSGIELRRFVLDALTAHGATVTSDDNGLTCLNLTELHRRHPGLRDAIALAIGRDAPESICLRFTPPATDDSFLLTRTHPLVEKLAAHVLDAALDDGRDAEQAVAKRLGAIRTDAVSRRTTLVLLRLRFQIHHRPGATPLLAEDCRVVGFEGAPDQPVWLEQDRVEELLAAQPSSNLPRPQAQQSLSDILDGFEAVRPQLDEVAKSRAEELREAHLRVREAARVRGEKAEPVEVEPKLPPDVLGVYVFLPVPKL